MCGLAGILNWQSIQERDVELVQAMTRALQHRGPDDVGLYRDQRVALGHRRLSVIDLTGGHQPLGNEDGTVWVVLNGEIYNYQTLTAWLQERGHQFKTRSDTETLVHLYEEKGEALVDDLRGMFSFAIWDTVREKLVLGRDRLGIKPMYYVQAGERLLFASELKALLPCRALLGDLNLDAVDSYLTLSYVPGPETIFTKVKRLLPGHVLVQDGNTTNTYEYWRPQEIQIRDWDPKEATEQLLEHLQESVRLRLIAEVPLGVFLSGGLDSSSIVAMMDQLGVRSVQTFSVGFGREYGKLDESGFARDVARHFDTAHHEISLRPEDMGLLPQVVWHLDEPSGDPAALPLYRLTQFARDYVTVVLCGDGGDEILGGYDRYVWEKVAAQYRMAPAPVRALVRRAVAWGDGALDGALSRPRRFLAGAECEPLDRYSGWLTYFDARQRAELYGRRMTDHLAAQSHLAKYLRSEGHRDWLSQIMYADLRTYLPFLLLEKGDRVTMSRALETRFPLLDHELVEFALSLPVQCKLRGVGTKYLLRRAMQGRLPQEIVSRKKRGFTVPVHQWFRDDLLRLSTSLLQTSRFADRALFDGATVGRLIAAHQDGRANHGYRLWLLVVFEIWCRLFVDGDALGAVEEEVSRAMAIEG